MCALAKFIFGLLLKFYMKSTAILNTSLKESKITENAAEILNSTIQQAGWKAGPEHNPKYYKKHTDPIIQTKIKSKRKLRKTWQAKT